ncbi:MAG: DMT family transporter [Saprospiraceae bacterium]|nr:DMT family transporter [Saprospiraceae bacterium]
MKEVALRKGLWYMLVASFSFALTGACARYLRNDINPIQLVLFRNVIGVGFIFWSVYRKPIVQTGGKLGLLIFRGFIGTLALYTFFYGISKIGLAISITYQQSYPIFLSIMAAWWFGERLKIKEWAAVIIGFVGIFLIFIPSADTSSLLLRNHLIGVSNAVMTGLAYLSIRGLSAIYDQRSIILSFMLSGIILPIISLGLGECMQVQSLDFLINTVDPIKYSHIPVIVLLGVAALIGQLFLTKAFSYQKTGVIAAVGYSNIVFSILFGVILGDGLPDVYSFGGIGLIILCGVLISFGQRR